MNKETALAFLRQHQPMPPELSGLLKAEYPHEMFPVDSPEIQAYNSCGDMMFQYEEVRKYFVEHSDSGVHSSVS
jgi:hypothetical protein